MQELDQHFITFAKSLERTIAAHGYGKLSRAAAKRVQSEQLRELLLAEAAFQAAVSADLRGAAVWARFFGHIAKAGSKSQAQPFFRERQDVFVREIAPYFRDRDSEGCRLRNFRINRSFIEFALREVEWPAGHVVRLLATAADRHRRALVEMNMPLGISKARAFWAVNVRGKKSALTFMDLVEHAAAGLLVAVDKFLPGAPTTASPDAFGAACDVFPSVVLTRVSAFLISAYSATPVHYSSADKRRIYRAQKILSQRPAGEIEFDDVVEFVNRDLPDSGKRVGADDLRGLLAASNALSLDTKSQIDGDDGRRSSFEATVDSDDFPDAVADLVEGRARMGAAVTDLDLRSRKILRMRGVEMEA